MKTVYNGMANGVKWSVNLDNIQDDDKRRSTIEALIDQGLTIIMQRVESGKDRAERAAAVPKTVAKMESGDYPFGGGGGGPRLTWAEKAERAFFVEYGRDEMGMKAAAAAEFAKHPIIAWDTITRRAVLAEVQSAGMDEKAVKALDLAWQI